MQGSFHLLAPSEDQLAAVYQQNTLLTMPYNILSHILL